MIECTSINIDGERRQWKWKDADELYEKWMDDFCDLPANDDPIFDVKVDGKDIREATFERIGTDSVWFEDLLTYVGIDIWGIAKEG